MFANIGYVLATIMSGIASLFGGHVASDAAPAPFYVAVPGSLLTVPSNIFDHTGQQQSPQPSALTASAASASAPPKAAPQPSAQPSAPPPKVETATTSDTKSDEPQGNLCNGKYWDACPEGTVFQCLWNGHTCRPNRHTAQVLSTTPALSSCQLSEVDLSSQIDALRKQEDQLPAADGNTDTSTRDALEAQIADLISRLHTLQSTCTK